MFPLLLALIQNNTRWAKAIITVLSTLNQMYNGYGKASFARAIGVYAGALGRGQIIDAPPAHLQEDERDDEHPESKALSMVWKVTIVHIDKIGQPGDGRPRLLGIPRPVVPPCLLGPESTEEHANGKEGEAYIDEIIGDV